LHLDLIKDDADLVVIDHLQYFDFLSNNEHAEITAIMKRIQNIKSKLRIPIVLVSHLRKKGKDRGFPDNDDFHGSSNIPKQADTCIIISHVLFDEDRYEDQIKTGIYQTGVRITKNRSGMSQRLLGVCNFDLNDRSYKNDYKMGICYPNSIDKIYGRPGLPAWARDSKYVRLWEKDGF